MRKFRVLAIVPALLFASGAHALSAEELIAKNIEAHGGLAAIKAIDNITATGKMTFGDGDFLIALDYQQVIARPGRMRVEATFQGMTAVNAYDGEQGWEISPFQGRKDPQRNTDDQSKALKLSADLEQALVDAKAKGYQVDYVGSEDVDGTQAHKLRVKLNATDTRTIYLDSDYFLEIRVEDRIQVRGAEQFSRTDLGDYEKVNGWYFPFYYESDGQKIQIEKIVANSAVDNQQFSFPVAPAK